MRGQGTRWLLRVSTALPVLYLTFELTEGLRAKGAQFRSLADPFDTNSPKGMSMMQMLDAFAEFERTLIRERTKAGVALAVARGSKPRNPRLRERDPIAIRMMKAALADTTLERTWAEARNWIYMVERYRPHLSWTNVARLINRERGSSERAHVTTLKAQVRRLVVRARDLPERMLDRTRPPTRDIAALLVQRIRAEQPKASLRALVAELDRRGFHPPSPLVA